MKVILPKSLWYLIDGQLVTNRTESKTEVWGKCSVQTCVFFGLTYVWTAVLIQSLTCFKGVQIAHLLSGQNIEDNTLQQTAKHWSTKERIARVWEQVQDKNSSDLEGFSSPESWAEQWFGLRKRKVESIMSLPGWNHSPVWPAVLLSLLSMSAESLSSFSTQLTHVWPHYSQHPKPSTVARKWQVSPAQCFQLLKEAHG